MPKIDPRIKELRDLFAHIQGLIHQGEFDRNSLNVATDFVKKKFPEGDELRPLAFEGLSRYAQQVKRCA